MNRVTKEIAILLKEVGYDVPTNAYYIETYHKCHEISTPKNFNEVQFYISAPTVYECIEWLDSKGVYVVPIYVGLRPNGWGCRITFKNEQYSDDEFIREIKDTRLAAYTAGLPIAINHIKNKKG